MDKRIEKYINKFGKVEFSGVTESTPMSELEFHLVQALFEHNIQHALHTNIGSITVLDRLTGFGWRDIETGYRDIKGEFWLASGNFDVRDLKPKTIGDAIKLIKENSNTCKGISWTND